MLNFDDIDDWAPKFSEALKPHVPDVVVAKLRAEKPRYIEDALEMLLDAGNRREIINATLVWIRSEKLAAYHGSRLTDEELKSVEKLGLLPLKAEQRRPRLVRALSRHPNWATVEPKLDAAIQAHGKGEAAGHREGKVEFVLSKSGLRGMSHYLTHGSEFDYHVVHSLLGEEGLGLLARDGKARIIQIVLSGNDALDATHRYPCYSVNEMLGRNEVPGLVRQFLQAWIFKLTDPAFQSSTLREGIGMVFRSGVPADWIVGCETLGSPYNEPEAATLS
jgi:hypothetical protein